MGCSSSKSQKVSQEPRLAPSAPLTAAPPPSAQRKRTGVDEVDDLPGEGDGCDRCCGAGCDEELCCPSFWQDSGVPPIWPLSWIFSRKNPYLNDNDYVEVLGNCGLKSADRERKVLMGTALGFTVCSIILTVFGCLALSPSPSLTRAAAWAVGHLRDPTTGQGTTAYVGLSRLLIVRCSDAPARSLWSEWGLCEQSSYSWSEVPALCEAGALKEQRAANEAELAAESGAEDVDYSLLNGRELQFDLGYPCAPLLACSEQALANRSGAFITCATLLFALIGCLTRIRKKADSNFQKIIGTFPDLIGIFTLGGTLIAFSARCTSTMLADANEVGTAYSAGPGFIGYCFCWGAAVVRFSMHAIMPVPHAGLLVQDIVDVAVDIAEDGRYDGYTKAARPPPLQVQGGDPTPAHRGPPAQRMI
ncbi:hypothetical protein KFE25_008390 [Diacronema lutheri]|uniref:Uncharacterized protein n=1 Tax=Diacronema lutheri TaxID=2081491 RepID=A0A8J5X8I6_DIALT|nr:hypothetical protein KFE25_008390 [Diacronema lutheri]